MNVLPFELYSIQHVRVIALILLSGVPFLTITTLNNKRKTLNNFPARVLTVFGYHHSLCPFPKANLVIFTGFANIFFVNMELIHVILVDLVIVLQLGTCNDG